MQGYMLLYGKFYFNKDKIFLANEDKKHTANFSLIAKFRHIF